MSGMFRIAEEIESEVHDWGSLRWISHPPSTGAKNLTVFQAMLAPGKGHNFHKHKEQEEALYVVAGRIEQWLDRQKRILGPGDSAFIPAGAVHASFNVGEDDARLVVIFSPCVGEFGFQSIEVAGEAPWNQLRA